MTYGKSVIASLFLATALAGAPAYLGCNNNHELGRTPQDTARHSDSSVTLEKQNTNAAAYR